jgi:hypothetical protein
MWLQPPAHAGSRSRIFSTLKMEAIRSSETSVNPRSTQRHILEDNIRYIVIVFLSLILILEVEMAQYISYFKIKLSLRFNTLISEHVSQQIRYTARYTVSVMKYFLSTPNTQFIDFIWNDNYSHVLRTEYLRYFILFRRYKLRTIYFTERKLPTK